jgi:O-acetyl-ADP-ribose deacetylase (regulator of RNase III)
VKEFLEKEDELDKVVFVLFTKGDLEIYREAAKEIL